MTDMSIILPEHIQYACELMENQTNTIDEAVSKTSKRFSRDPGDLRLSLPETVCIKAKKESESTTRAVIDMNIAQKHKLVAVIFTDRNECCCENHSAPVLLTLSRLSREKVYSCQCSCGGWCTNGHSTPDEAVREYEVMCEEYANRRENEHDE